MTKRKSPRRLRRNDIVFFRYRGLLCCSPVLKVNAKTITVVLSDGERRISPQRVWDYEKEEKHG